MTRHCHPLLELLPYAVLLASARWKRQSQVNMKVVWDRDGDLTGWLHADGKMI